MPRLGSSNNSKPNAQKRCRFPKEFEDEAVQMLLDGHSATSIAASLRLSGPNLLYRWKRELIGQAVKRSRPPKRSMTVSANSRQGCGGSGRNVTS